MLSATPPVGGGAPWGRNPIISRGPPPAGGDRRMSADETRDGEPTAPRRLVDYYRFLEVARNAPTEEIVEAYLAKVQGADARTVERAERVLAVLSDPPTRAAYDRDLAA